MYAIRSYYVWSERFLPGFRRIDALMTRCGSNGVGEFMAKNKDVVTGLIAIGLAIFLFVISGNVRDFAAVGVGAGFLPRVAAVLMGILGVALTIESWRQGASRSLQKKPAPASRETTSDVVEVFGGWVAVVLSAGLMCAYVGLLEYLGFILTSTLYAFCQILILAKNAKRNYLLFGGISLATSVIAYFLFVRVFQVIRNNFV